MAAALRTSLPGWLLVLLALAALASGLRAQDPPQDLAPATVQALERLADRIQQKRAQRDAALEGADPTRIAALEEELQQLSWQFAALTARFDVREFEAPTEREFDLQSEVESLIAPVIEAVKDLTAESRQIKALETRIERLVERREQAEAAQRAASRTRDLLPEGSDARAEAEREVMVRWKATIQNLRDELQILEARLKSIVDAQVPLLDRVNAFLRNSGLNLLLCGIAFFVVLFTMRWLQNRVLSAKRQERAVSVRVLEVLFSAGGLILAIAATMVVPYVRNDFLLLAIGIIFLIGAGWVLVKMAPQFFEQIRLILNIGSVREGERIIVEGLPYRVDNLRFYSTLSNPDLQGGELRVPIQELIGRRSRKPDPDEPWFPSKVGDVVMLSGDVIGPVTVQTPELVVVEDYAAPRTYTATAYLAENPRNLSRGFAVLTVFGIDYRHQHQATNEIPAALTAAVRDGLGEFVPAEQVVSVDVEFEAAGNSSLDLEARVEFTGAAAPKYRELRRALQHLLVEACTKNGWTIPFPQLTVHRAD